MMLSIFLGTTQYANAASTITGPDGNTYTYIGDAKYVSPTNKPLTFSLNGIKASNNVHIVFYCPNNSRHDLAQGTAVATPVSNGTTKNYSFINYFDEINEMDFSTLSGTGTYNISFQVDSIGTSGKVSVYYRIY